MFELSDIKLTRDQRVAITNLIQTIFIFKNNKKISKGHNSLKIVDGVLILVLCTLSDDGSYLYQVS